MFYWKGMKGDERAVYCNVWGVLRPFTIFGVFKSSGVFSNCGRSRLSSKLFKATLNYVCIGVAGEKVRRSDLMISNGMRYFDCGRGAGRFFD
jgi:hypothetical protein